MLGIICEARIFDQCVEGQTGLPPVVRTWEQTRNPVLFQDFIVERYNTACKRFCDRLDRIYAKMLALQAAVECSMSLTLAVDVQIERRSIPCHNGKSERQDARFDEHIGFWSECVGTRGSRAL